jgi:L-cystine transport system permease protein
MNNLFEWDRFFSAVTQITPYLGITAQIVVTAVVFGSLLGFIVALLRINKIPVVQQLLDIYISFMRGTPMVIQMMLIYYALPLFLQGVFGININSWEKLSFVKITFVVNEGAFLGEIFKSAIEAVPYQQTEAGYSVGLNRIQTFVRIVLPQSIRIALPAYGVDIIGVFHNTSIAFMIGVIDIVGRAQSIKSSTGHGLEAYIYLAGIYVIISILLKYAFNKADKKLVYGRGEA